MHDLLVVLVILILLVVPPLFGRGRRAAGVPKEFSGAPIGIGTVLGVTPAGRSRRDRQRLDIRLRVDTADGRTFDTTMRQVVDRDDLVAVRPDALMPVRYLTDGRVTPAADAPTHELQAALDRVHVAKGWLTPKQLRITEYGTDTTAVVVDATQAGPTADGRAAVRLHLVVTRPDGTTFAVTQDKKLAPASLPQVRPGLTVRVRYLPYDESDVAVLTTVAR